MEILSQMLARNLRLVPERAFIVTEAETISHGEFGARTARLANVLAGLGVGAAALLRGLAEPAVGLALDRALGFLAADALAGREALVRADKRDEQAGRREHADDPLERAESLNSVRDRVVEREQDRDLDGAGHQLRRHVDAGRDHGPRKQADDPREGVRRERLEPAQPEVDHVADHREQREQVQEWHSLE